MRSVISVNPGVTWLRWTCLDGVATDLSRSTIAAHDYGTRVPEAGLGVTLAMLAHIFPGRRPRR